MEKDLQPQPSIGIAIVKKYEASFFTIVRVLLVV